MSNGNGKNVVVRPGNKDALVANRIKPRRPVLNDQVETLYLELYDNPRFQRLTAAVDDESAVEGNMAVDSSFAAQMIRELALKKKEEEPGSDRFDLAATLPAWTVAKSLNRIQGWYNDSRKQRRTMRDGVVQPPEGSDTHGAA
jgi:hypothetical protein